MKDKTIYIDCRRMMMHGKVKLWAGIVLLTILLSGCSTTRNLPEGEVLYKGIKKTIVNDEDKTNEGQDALADVKAAVSYKPNNSLFGSSSVTYYPPIGLWIYNSFSRYKKGLGKWIFDKLAAKPVLISTVNPELRVKVAQNLLHDYGYFNGTVNYEVIPLRKPRQSKIEYTINMRQPYMLDSIAYLNFPPRADSLIRADWQNRLLRSGTNFSVVQLDAERQRLSTLFRNRGYFYFRPDFITYRADTLIRPGMVSLQVVPEKGLPAIANRQWYVGRTSAFLTGYDGSLPTDSMQYKNLLIHYSGKRPGIRPSVLYKRLRVREGRLYSQRAQTRAQENLNRLGVFRYAEFQYAPRDTLSTCDTLDLRVNAAFDLPLDGELEVNVTSKSNDQVGPGAVFSVSKRNILRGGETFSVRLRGSYEWQTNSSIEGKKSAINSYEYGVSTSLDLPWVVFPWLHKKDFNFPATTTFRLYADMLNRAGFFRMLSFGGNATYNFQPSLTRKHSVTPFRLTYNLLNGTQRFDSIMDANPALYLSLKNQFIPAMSYTYTYDDARVKSRRNHLWWETSVTSAGNILSGFYAIAGKKFNTKDKELFGNHFAQFAKLTSEVRFNYKINAKQNLVSRFMAGAVYAYGNAKVAPYTEQFFIGGANSIRAFTVRSIGPGSYRPQNITKYSYIDQTGDLKFEANVEYRFNILGHLYGATFLDAGNIWLIKKDPDRPGGQFTFSNLGKEIALGTGAGLRYDLTFLVIRFDVGIGIHAPYDTGKKGYYNIPKFKDGVGYHLAIGYPF